MPQFVWVALVTLVFGFTLFGMSLVVSRYRVKLGVAAPSVTGHPKSERAYRAHMNTVEWTPIFLPAMWVLAAYWSGVWAALLGAAWVIGRITYFVGYVADPEKGSLGMSIQAAAALALSMGSLGRIIYLLIWGHVLSR